MERQFTEYNDWGTVLFFILFFLIFALSFTRPKTSLDWRSFGAFSAFIVALFIEMYGFPLTLYFLAGWLQQKFPEMTVFDHSTGHLWHTIFGLEGSPHNHFIDIVSSVLIIGGLVLLGIAWRVLYRAQASGTLARSGIYSVVRHPQYIAFASIMLGYLLTWPTILTLPMFPVLLYMYYRLAKREEQGLRQEFGGEYEAYAEATPGFIPAFRASHRD